MYVHLTMGSVPVTEQQLAELKKQQDDDETCRQLNSFCESGWPSQHLVKGTLKAYQPFAAERTIQQG